MHFAYLVAPLCRPGQVQIYNVARQETAKVICELESNPNDLNFTWKFNNTSTESIDLPASLIAVDRAKSIAHYTPMVEQVSAQNQNNESTFFLFRSCIFCFSFVCWKKSTEITLLFFIPSLANWLLIIMFSVLISLFYFQLFLSVVAVVVFATHHNVTDSLRCAFFTKKKYIKRMLKII